MLVVLTVCGTWSVLPAIVFHIVFAKAHSGHDISLTEVLQAVLIVSASCSYNCDEGVVITSMYIEADADDSSVLMSNCTGGEARGPI